MLAINFIKWCQTCSVTHFFQFNLKEYKGATTNCPVIRQPSPFLYHGLENNHEHDKEMEAASLLAKRDIRLGKFSFNEDDLDLVPVKERKTDSNVRPISNALADSEKSTTILHGSFSPGRHLMNHHPRKNTSLRNKIADVTLPSKSKKSTEHVVNIPTAGIEIFPKNNTKNSLSVIVDNLLHAYNDLKKPPSQKRYPDEIEQERLQRRVEEQRRHLYRMLYNTKRHVNQLVMQLERTAFNHRKTVMSQSNTLCHLNTAYRSLMSGLNSFIRVSHTLHSTFMTELKKKVRAELSSLLKELKTVCNLMDIQIATLDSPVNSPAVTNPHENAQISSPVQKLEIDGKISKHIPEGPLSPERNESLKAAVKSLITAELSKKQTYDVKQRSNVSNVPQQKSISMNRKVPKNKPLNKKVIRPKSTSSTRKIKEPSSFKRPVSANPGKGKRPLGDVENCRPISTPSLKSADPLEIHGNITPFITEREMARQAWIDELGKSRTSYTGAATPADTNQAYRNPTRSPIKASGIETYQRNGIDTTMVQLLNKLEEIEREDEEIRSRWLHIQYSDPHKPIDHDQSPVVLPSADLLEPVSEIIPSVHSTCFRTQLAEVKVIPKQRIFAIESYRDSMLQYLRLTKHFKTERFDPWLTINNVVDEIIGSLVRDLCKEITSSCDSLASNIYLSEFLPA